MPKAHRKLYPHAIVTLPPNEARRPWKPQKPQAESGLASTPQSIITADRYSWVLSVLVAAVILGMFGTIIYFLGWKATVAVVGLIVVALVAFGNHILNETIEL